MCSLWSLFFLVLLKTCSVEGSSYCIADCDSNGRKPSLYLQYCCDISNRGKALKIQHKPGHKIYVLCPSELPTSCQVSCSQLYKEHPTSLSSYYNIILSNGSQVEVYCDMEGSHCDEEGGWTRVAFVNMSEPGSSCPPGLVQYDNIFNTSLCWINNETYSPYWRCKSTFFSTYGLNYTKICGQVRGYQYGIPYAFYCDLTNTNCFNSEIKTFGVTFTYSNNPRKHIWTYAGGGYEQGTNLLRCPCNNGSEYMNVSIPFVGNDYYCESGLSINQGFVLYPNDPLWDGQDCRGIEATCCISPKMPWFVKTLNETVSDDIELIMCGYNNGQINVHGTLLDLVELYIK